VLVSIILITPSASAVCPVVHALLFINPFADTHFLGGYMVVVGVCVGI
jgi:hypothetical protein